MKKRLVLVGLVFLALFMAILTASIQSSESTEELYVFGDSLSDVGNVYQATEQNLPPSPPYFQGRYSNGPVWVEYLANHLSLVAHPSSNFAYGGATTDSRSNSDVPDLLTQVQTFAKGHQRANAQALYVIWIGANDYLRGAVDSQPVVQRISEAIAHLTSSGATRILVANLPDLGRLPATRTDSRATTLSRVTQSHNAELTKMLNELQPTLRSNTRIIELDVNALYQDALANPETFGLDNVTTACLTDQSTCSNPDQYLYWDGIHPTTSAHRVMAERAVAVLQSHRSLGSQSKVLFASRAGGHP